MKTLLLLLLFPMMSFGQNVNIPDANFKNYLVNNSAINTNGDNEIQVSEASAYTGTISCYYQSIADLTGIEAFTALTDLRCFGNQLTSLDLSNNTALSYFQCNSNQLTSLDLSNNTALTELNCSFNNLTSLDVSNNTTLTELSCYDNQLTSLDLSNNSNLIKLYCSDNQLECLNIQNGNNTAISGFYFSSINNPTLTCIEVDDVNYSTANWTNIDSQTSFSTYCNNACSPTVYIPDANFKNYLVNNSSINTNGDGEIQVGEASAYSSYINCSNQNISDLTGIEYFIGLTTLTCTNNQLTSLDLSNNSALTSLSFGNNQLTSLDVSNNTALTDLSCWTNQLTSLNISNNTALSNLNCGNNQITSLDVSNNTALEYLICYDNQLTSLDVSNNTALEFLECYNNQLTSLNVSNNTALEFLKCYNNQLTSLDLSSNIALTDLRCHNNQLECLNVKNGNNSAISGFNFSSLNNPTLTCIEVDDVNYSTANWTNIDSQTSFSSDCNSSTDVITACDSYTWIDGNTYTSSNNTATYNIPNAVGCGDIIITLNLTINNSSSSTDVIIACDSYTWVDGNTYTASNNTATYTTTNAAGCDSVVTLDLTINYSNTVTDVIIACDSYTWVDGNTYTASNNTATYTTTNAAGCDSVVTLDLTINYSNTGTDVITACDSYTWVDGNTYTASNNSATYTTTNAAGCDSVVTLDLTINPSPDVSVTENGAFLNADQTGVTYQWIDCDNGNTPLSGEINQFFNPTSTGNYAVIVTVNGCSDTSDCILVDFTGIGELNNTPKDLIKIVDVLGRETPFKPNTPLLYIYNDGTVERKVIIEE